jgi:hypothetical protein
MGLLQSFLLGLTLLLYISSHKPNRYLASFNRSPFFVAQRAKSSVMLVYLRFFYQVTVKYIVSFTLHIGLKKKERNSHITQMIHNTIRPLVAIQADRFALETGPETTRIVRWGDLRFLLIGGYSQERLAWINQRDIMREDVLKRRGTNTRFLLDSGINYLLV